MNINIITRCTRLHNLKEVKKSIFNNIPEGINIQWHVMFDVTSLKDIDAELIFDVNDENTIYHFERGDPNGMLYPQCGKLIKTFKDTWVYFIDDDNILHPNFYKTIYETNQHHPYHNVYVFSQNVDGKDYSGLKSRIAIPSAMKVGSVDLAQYIIHSNVYNNMGYAFEADYCADGILIEKVHNEKPDIFFFIEKELCYYNALSLPSTANVPKVIYIGKDMPVLRSMQYVKYEAHNLNVLYLKNDDDIIARIASFKPDSIVTRGNSWKDFKNLSQLPLQFRRKWINMTPEKTNQEVGEAAYQCAMLSMLDINGLEDADMVSYFTPIYNIGNKLYNTYQSLLDQTYSNWEWVIVNDSTDGGRSLKVAEKIASKDPRVKVYDFREKSGGNIGDVKWKCCTLAKGYLLVELDHDDLLVPSCTMDLFKASKKHPEAGFFFNDTLEVNEQWESQTYPDGFALGYGKYRSEEYNGNIMSIATQHNINPKTIRHIVGVPNHVRAWRRSTYFEIGGHNRNLTIADDYELVVRTFLKTITCKIPKLGYVQFLYSNQNGQNTHDLARADIQRRVRTISSYYNEQIADRFTDLGLNDWAYAENPNSPLNTESRYGVEEMAANIIYQE
jgi:glycosyltransferase involved in cell wall biosynthesis